MTNVNLIQSETIFNCRHYVNSTEECIKHIVFYESLVHSLWILFRFYEKRLGISTHTEGFLSDSALRAEAQGRRQRDAGPGAPAAAAVWPGLLCSCDGHILNKIHPWI